MAGSHEIRENHVSRPNPKILIYNFCLKNTIIDKKMDVNLSYFHSITMK